MLEIKELGIYVEREDKTDDWYYIKSLDTNKILYSDEGQAILEILINMREEK
jgi:hypothetical protein